MAIKVIDTFIEYGRSFTMEDLLRVGEEQQDQVLTGDQQASETLLQVIGADPRFLSAHDETDGNRYFIFSMILCHWFVNLNVRLAKAGSTRIDIHRLALLMSSMRSVGIWTSPPNEFIAFGQKYSFVSPTLSQREYIFPLARILSFMLPSRIKHAVEYLNNFSHSLDSAINAVEVIQKSIEDVLGELTYRQRYVVARRQGLIGNAKMTLEEIGQKLRISRERVRQIEEKSWRRLRHPSRIRTLIPPLMSYILMYQGSLVVAPCIRPEMTFITGLLNIPLSQFPDSNLWVLGNTDKRLRIPMSIWDRLFDIEAAADFLQSNFNLVLNRSDLTKITKTVTPVLLNRLTKRQRVYLTLKHIDRPAHSSEITEVHNFLFPNRLSSERNIHAALSYEKHGVVWIGIHSTFALKEWGYEHPSSTLFDTVSRIVAQKYIEAGKPVPFLVIQAEIGKYRKAVRPNSIIFATYYNPSLKQIRKDFFIPKPADEFHMETTDEELDRILQEFERRRKGRSYDD